MLQSNPRKAQTSLEFLTMLIFVMMAFAAFYTVFGQQQVDVQQAQAANYAGAIADRIAFELDMALTQGDGYRRNITLPQAIGGEGYTVSLNQGTVLVMWSDRSVVASTAADSITGTVTPGRNRIRNEDGVLYID